MSANAEEVSFERVKGTSVEESTGRLEVEKGTGFKIFCNNPHNLGAEQIDIYDLTLGILCHIEPEMEWEWSNSQGQEEKGEVKTPLQGGLGFQTHDLGNGNCR